MKRFIQYFFEETEGKVSSNTKGVLHELLVGRHLNGGEHMEAHPNSAGETPEQAHDRLKSTLTDAQYNEINNKAKAAADDIRKKVGAHGEVHKVQWTSKAGDLHKATGIHATQKQDASDIVITSKNKKGEIKHHGVSLKVSDKKNKHVPVSNPGMESTYGGNAILKKHREEIDKAHPELAKIEGAKAKKAWLKSNAKANADVRARNTKTLNDITQHLHNKLNSMSSEDLAQHIRHHVLAAHATPMQEQGHEHFRHTTGGVGGDFSMHVIHPDQDHEHILNDHKNIKAVRRGTSIIFTHNNKPFAKHRMKFENQGNPNSSVKGSHSFHGVTQLIKKHKSPEEKQAIYNKFKASVSKMKGMNHKPALAHLRHHLGVKDEIEESLNEEAEQHAHMSYLGASPHTHMGHHQDVGGSMNSAPDGKKFIGLSGKSDAFSDKEREDIANKQSSGNIEFKTENSPGHAIARAYKSMKGSGKKILHLHFGHDRKDFAEKLKGSIEAGKIPELEGNKPDEVRLHFPKDENRSHGMSGTKMRTAAAEGDLPAYKKHLGPNFSDKEAKGLMDRTRVSLMAGKIKVKR